MDGGQRWEPVSDKFFKTGSVGAIAVAESDPNVIYAGMGEACIRGNTSSGDGVWKSTDAGKSWRNVGLTETRQISAVVVHPRNPDLVWVAALGHTWGPNPDRGIFRSADGGTTWKKVLFVDEKTGAIASLRVDGRELVDTNAATAPGPGPQGHRRRRRAGRVVRPEGGLQAQAPRPRAC